MSNDYYNVTGTPATLTRGSSSPVRSEYSLIDAAFTKLPTLAGLYGATQNYAVDAGTVNAISVTLNSAITSYVDGLTVRVKVAYANTSTSPTINVNGIGVIAIMKNDGNPPSVGDIPAGICEFTYNASTLRFTYAPPGATGPIGPSYQILYSERTSNTQLENSDRGYLIDITSGTFTQAFASNLASGWFVFYRNSGTGVVTIPASDGVSNWAMYPGEVRIYLWDANSSIVRSIILNPFYYAFTSTGTFTKPPGYSYFDGLIWCGGNSGEKSGGAGLARGGGGGGCFPIMIPAASVGATETVTIGAGGVGNLQLGGFSSFGSFVRVSAGANGADGGAICINSTISSTGMSSSLATAQGFAGAVASGFATYGVDSVYGGSCSVNDASAISGSSLFGGAAGGSVNGTGTLRAAGTSKLGGNGGAAGDSTSGTDGTAPGGGGGATRTGTKSGDGARGECRVWGIV